MRRFWKKDILTIWLITHQVSCWLFKFGWETWKSKLSSWEGLKSAIILVNINQQPYLFCTAPSPPKNNKTQQQLSAADADLFVSPASELQQTKPIFFLGVVNQHQPHQSSKKIAHKLGSWWFTKTQRISPPFNPTFHPPFPTLRFAGNASKVESSSRWWWQHCRRAESPTHEGGSRSGCDLATVGCGTGLGLGNWKGTDLGNSCCVVFYSKISETSKELQSILIRY